ncbi:MAG TPA: glycosyltransferase family 2 protein [Vicinamibacterales bacterium]|nr:glycosyltransferase family 2 protein [Vicinamibacterales bacterium]
MKLSIVTTLYKSSPYIQEFYARVTHAAAAITTDYELLFVNDGSPDDACDQAIALHRRDIHVRVLDLSRNFGHHKAMMTGLQHARGDLVFLVDVDLEEQPEWLLRFHATMSDTGADSVYGVQERRKGGWFERVAGAAFYKSFNAWLDHPIPENAVTARLMTRRYVDSLVQHRDREMTMAPLWVMTGYRQIAVVVEKKSRRETSYGVRHRIAALVDNITSFSNRPLVYIFYLGTFIMLISTAYGIWLIWQATHGEVGVPGWPTLIVSIWFLGGITIFCIGVIGVYLSKVFSETKDRPYTIVRADYDHDVAVPR